MARFFRLLLLTTLAAFFVGCDDKSPEGRPVFTTLEDTTALYYYGLRAEGRYEEYVASMQSCDGASPEYRNAMVSLIRHHQTEVNRTKGGVAYTETIRKEMHDGDSMANVFLAVTFRDSTREEIMIPLVFHQGEWRIR